MDEPILKSGQWPNIAIDPRTGRHAVTGEEIKLGSVPPYDELLRCLENDWNVRASWDGLRKFWCIELTDEGVRLRDATLGSGECEFIIEDNMNETEGMGDVWFRCTNCATTFDYYADDWLMKQNYCPHCGFKIRKAVKR